MGGQLAFWLMFLFAAADGHECFVGVVSLHDFEQFQGTLAAKRCTPKETEEGRHFCLVKTTKAQMVFDCDEGQVCDGEGEVRQKMIYWAFL